MSIFEIRQHAGYLFLAVTLGHVILISAQVNSRSGVPVLEAVTFGLFAEAQRIVVNIAGQKSENESRANIKDFFGS